jgi:hypothetical protein
MIKEAAQLANIPIASISISSIKDAIYEGSRFFVEVC